MRKLLSLFLVLCTVLTICSCTPTEDDGVTNTEPTAEITDTVGTSATDTVTEEANSPATTDAPSEDAAPEFTPYTVEIGDPLFPIYSEPGYEYMQTGTVGEAGVYTIVEEAPEVEGTIWGKLKSGAGWIDLTLLKIESEGILTADHADEKLLASDNYHYFASATDSSGVKIAFSAIVNLEDVSFCSLDMSENYQRGPELFRIPTWKPSQPFVVSVPFAGDMSAYELSCSYRGLFRYQFTVMISGRDGSIELLPVPATDDVTTDTALPQLTMMFCSGVGAWHTELKINEDGSFYGSYQDADMGDIGDGYPNGTVYCCEFEGKFTITEKTENAIYLRMPTLTEKPTPAEKWIEDGTLYVSSGAYGLEGGETFILYLPGNPIDMLPVGVLWWGEMNGFLKKTDTVTTYHILYCVETGNTFF